MMPVAGQLGESPCLQVVQGGGTWLHTRLLPLGGEVRLPQCETVPETLRHTILL